MPEAGRLYPYAGPSALRELGVQPSGFAITTPTVLAAWLGTRGLDELTDPFTFTVNASGDLLLAPRRSEHVHCAGGQEVLAAGEITFSQDGRAWRVVAVSNHSTGYCPAPESWPTVAAALDRAGIPHPVGYDPVIVFRRCPACQAINIVHDEHLACAICEGSLPREWNISQKSLPAEPRSAESQCNG
jgi:hypothetical protein